MEERKAIDEFMKRGEKIRKEVEQEFRDRAKKLQKDGEDQCFGFIEKACKDVEEGTRGEEFCKSFFSDGIKLEFDTSELDLGRDVESAAVGQRRTSDARPARGRRRVRKERRRKRTDSSS